MLPTYKIDTPQENLAPMSKKEIDAIVTELGNDRPEIDKAYANNVDGVPPTMKPFDGDDALLYQIVAAIVHEPDFVREYEDLLSPDAFRNSAHREIAKCVLSHRKRFGEHPSKAEIRQQLSEQKAAGTLLGELEAACDQYAPGLYVKKRFVDYLETQNLRLYQLQTLNLLQRHPRDWKEQEKALREEYEARTTPKQTKAAFLDVMADDFTEGESTEELIANFLPRGQSMLFGGRSKAGKSVMMHPLMCCILYGDSFLGGVAMKPVPILYLDYEGRRTYFRRWFDRFRRNRNTSTVSEHLHYAGLSEHPEHGGRAPDFLTVDWLNERIKIYEEPGVIIVDTFRGAFCNTPGIDPDFENKPPVVGSILRPLTKWCHDTGWTMIILHHFNKQGKLSGCTEFSAACDTVCLFDRDVDGCGDECEFTMLGRFFEAQEKRFAKFHPDHLEYLGTASEVGRQQTLARMAKQEEEAAKAIRNCKAEAENLVATLCSPQSAGYKAKYSLDELISQAMFHCGLSANKAKSWIRAMNRHDIFEVETAKFGKKFYRATAETSRRLADHWPDMLGEFISS